MSRWLLPRTLPPPAAAAARAAAGSGREPPRALSSSQAVAACMGCAARAGGLGGGWGSLWQRRGARCWAMRAPGQRHRQQGDRGSGHGAAAASVRGAVAWGSRLHARASDQHYKCNQGSLPVSLARKTAHAWWAAPARHSGSGRQRAAAGQQAIGGRGQTCPCSPCSCVN